jgi:hypothetical protein
LRGPHRNSSSATRRYLCSQLFPECSSCWREVRPEAQSGTESNFADPTPIGARGEALDRLGSQQGARRTFHAVRFGSGQPASSLMANRAKQSPFRNLESFSDAHGTLHATCHYFFRLSSKSAGARFGDRRSASTAGFWLPKHSPTFVLLHLSDVPSESLPRAATPERLLRPGTFWSVAAACISHVSSDGSGRVP